MSDYSFIDLHTHTNHSKESGCDDTVDMVLRDAQAIADRSGKNCLIAITDHNAITGVMEAKQIIESGKYPSIKLISGAEFTVDMSEMNAMFGGSCVFKNMHILAYGFNENHPALADFVNNGGLVYGKKLKYSKLIEIMREAGGVLILAHPGLIKVNVASAGNYQIQDEYINQIKELSQNARRSKTIMRNIPNSYPLLKVLIEKMQKMGAGIMIGMERFHPDNYFKDFNDVLGRLCDENGLVQTAGSDFHGYHLHIDFSVGNSFTSNFQEFYKETLKDCENYRNGIHVSYLPGIDFLTGESQTIDGEIKMISGNGEEITFEQYQTLVSAYKEHKRKLIEANPNFGQQRKNSQKNNLSNSQSSENRNVQNNSGKKGKKHKHKHHKKQKGSYYGK